MDVAVGVTRTSAKAGYLCQFFSESQGVAKAASRLGLKARSWNLHTHGQLGDLRPGNDQRHIAQDMSKEKMRAAVFILPSLVGGQKTDSLPKVLVHLLTLAHRRGIPWLFVRPCGSRLFDASPIQCLAQDVSVSERRQCGSRWKRLLPRVDRQRGRFFFLHRLSETCLPFLFAALQNILTCQLDEIMDREHHGSCSLLVSRHIWQNILCACCRMVVACGSSVNIARQRHGGILSVSRVRPKVRSGATLRFSWNFWNFQSHLVGVVLFFLQHDTHS